MMTYRFGLLVIALAVASCSGEQLSVQRLDPRDKSLPVDSRRWLAEAEDGVIAARAAHDSAETKLAQLEEWRREVRETKWSRSLESALERLVDARIALAETDVELERARVVFALAKYRSVTAERAVEHDLARYDLEPLKHEVDAAGQLISKYRTESTKQQAAVDEATREWWRAYAQHVKRGGSTNAFWIGNAEPIQIADSKSKKPSEKAKK